MKTTIRPLTVLPLLLGLLIGSVLPVHLLAASASHDSKSLNRELFDVREFRKLQRQNHRGKFIIDDRSGSQKTASPILNRPCTGTGSGTGPSGMLQMNEMTTTQRTTMRQQLRNHACPVDVSMCGYRLLCESLLKDQPKWETKTGLRNDAQ